MIDWSKKASKITIFATAAISLIVLFGYMMIPARAARKAYKRAEAIWEMPNYIPKMRQDVRDTKLILEYEFGKIENGKYIPNESVDSR